MIPSWFFRALHAPPVWIMVENKAANHFPTIKWCWCYSEINSAPDRTRLDKISPPQGSFNPWHRVGHVCTNRNCDYFFPSGAKELPFSILRLQPGSVFRLWQTVGSFLVSFTSVYHFRGREDGGRDYERDIEDWERRTECAGGEAREERKGREGTNW